MLSCTPKCSPFVEILGKILFGLWCWLRPCNLGQFNVQPRVECCPLTRQLELCRIANRRRRYFLPICLHFLFGPSISFPWIFGRFVAEDSESVGGRGKWVLWRTRDGSWTMVSCRFLFQLPHLSLFGSCVLFCQISGLDFLKCLCVRKKNWGFDALLLSVLILKLL